MAGLFSTGELSINPVEFTVSVKVPASYLMGKVWLFKDKQFSVAANIYIQGNNSYKLTNVSVMLEQELDKSFIIDW